MNTFSSVSEFTTYIFSSGCCPKSSIPGIWRDAKATAFCTAGLDLYLDLPLDQHQTQPLGQYQTQPLGQHQTQHPRQYQTQPLGRHQSQPLFSTADRRPTPASLKHKFMSCSHVKSWVNFLTWLLIGCSLLRSQSGGSLFVDTTRDNDYNSKVSAPAFLPLTAVWSAVPPPGFCFLGSFLIFRFPVPFLPI